MFTYGVGPDTDRLAALYRYGLPNTTRCSAFDAVTADVSVALGGMTVTMVLVDDHRLWTGSVAGPPLDEGPKQGAMSTAVIEQTVPLVIDDTLRDPRFCTAPAVIDGSRIRAYAGVPLRTMDEHTIGVLATSDTKPRVFQEQHVALLQHAAKRLMEELEILRAARRDPATNAMTRMAFLEQVDAMAALAARHKRDLSLLVIEIDPFRTLLESFKLDLGRLLIDRMGGLGRSHVRRLDTFGRLSDSLFAVLLPDTSVTGATHLATRIVDKLAEGWSFPSPQGVATPVGIGLSTLRPGLDSAEDFTARALASCHVSPSGQEISRQPDFRVA